MIIQLEADGVRVSGRGVSTDVVEASARAYLSAVNKVLRVKARNEVATPRSPLTPREQGPAERGGPVREDARLGAPSSQARSRLSGRLGRLTLGLFFRQYYLGCLSHASYLIGDETTGRAVVVDPQRDVDEYLADAAAAGLRSSG